MIGYVYLIKNLINGKVYVGSHTSKSFDKHYYGSGTIIKLAIKKYGRKNFKRKVLFKANSLEELQNVETHFINKIKNKYGDNIYNIGLVGGKAMMGRSHSLEARKRMSEQRKGKNNSMYGVRLTGNKNGMWGKKHSPETKEKIKKSLNSFEILKKANIGKKRTAEQKKNVGDKNRGRLIKNDLIGDLMIFYRKNPCYASRIIKNHIAGYRGGFWQRQKTIEKNIKIISDYFGCKSDLLLRRYNKNPDYFKVS